jgi:predicted esterase
MPANISHTLPLLAVAFACAWGIHPDAPAQDLSGLEKGKVNPHVVSLSDAHHRYALYIPSNYDPAKKWPVLFAFDPMARGNIPVERFREAAEEYGYIVFGSNNSRNGPLQVQLEAMRAMYSDARQRFAIDPSRLYAAGFSGGARVACQMGLMLKGMAGVIAVGGGFPAGVKPSPEVSFALYGIAGEADLNFNELLRLHRDFTALGISNHFQGLEGGHQWPAGAICREAIEWMDLQGMRAGYRDRDPALIATLLAARLRKLRADEAGGRLAAALRGFDEAVRDFQDLADMKDFQEESLRLKVRPQAAKALRDAEKREKRLEEQDDLQSWRFTKVLNHILLVGGVSLAEGKTEISGGASGVSSSVPTAQGSPPTRGLEGAGTDSMVLEKLVADLGISRLRRAIEKKPGTDEAILAERQRDRIFISTLESGRTLMEAKKYPQAVKCFEITTEVMPESPFGLFNLARALAFDGQRNRALKSLARAAERGFDRPELVENDAAFDDLRKRPPFAAALEKIRHQAKLE